LKKERRILSLIILLKRKRKIQMAQLKLKSKKKISKWKKKNKMIKINMKTPSNQLQNRQVKKKMKKRNSFLLSVLNQNLNLRNLAPNVSILKSKRAKKKIMLKPKIIRNKQLEKIKNPEVVIPTFNTNVATVLSSSS